MEAVEFAAPKKGCQRNVANALAGVVQLAVQRRNSRMS
jgi:hypothetical protein